MVGVFPIPALRDNYIWCIEHPNGYAVVVDPGDAVPVIEVITKKKLELSGILLTHHHYDHTGGVSELLKFKSVPVWGASEIKQVNSPVISDCQVSLGEETIRFEVFKVPGHTLEHVAYFHKGLIFTGDTLFTAGCGKIFEGTVEQMYDSLMKLRSLPDDTLIYCGHEYTENNLAFALLVEPNNEATKKRQGETQALRSENKPTVPAMLSLEKETNPFLRCDHPDVILAASKYSNKSLNDPKEVLGVIREWKNNL